MAINFNSLPTTKPGQSAVFPKGQYIATIKKAEMKQPKDETKPMYYTAECDITDPISKTMMGKFWINLFESEAVLPMFQLGRFIKALNLPITGEFELKDLTKITVGKQLLVDICPENRTDGKPPQRSQVDVSAECFYPITSPESNDNAELEALLAGEPVIDTTATVSSSY